MHQSCMNWEQRIDLSFTLLKEFAALVGGEESKEILDILLAMSDFVSSDEFKNSTDQEKHDRSVEILGDAIGTCAKLIMHNERPESPPVYMTREQVKERLRQEYLKSVDTDCEMASMSVSDWIAENNIVIVDEGDTRLEEQSSSSSGEACPGGGSNEGG